MAGVTDQAFRTLCLRYGAGLTYSEMVSAKGLHYAGEATWRLVEPAPEEERFAVQLFGADPHVMAEQAAAVERHLGERLVLIDVNMGCPVRKVVAHGEGSALMKTPELACEIVARMVDTVNVPVTAKFRSGWTNDDVTAVEFAQGLERAGAALLAVHGRSSRQMYRGKADWSVIAQVKQAVNVPVAGSGDVWSHEDALAMQRETGVDAVMVARGARGNPWVFSGHVPTQAERVQAMREHLDLYVQLVSSEHLTPLRTQFPFYIKGLPGAAELRRAFSDAVTREDFERVLDEAQQRACRAQDELGEQGAPAFEHGVDAHEGDRP